MSSKISSTRFIFSVLAIVSLIAGFPGLAEAKTSKAKKAALAAAKLSDASFVNEDALGVTQIQNILAANGSFLKDFKEGGRTAAQIIHDAAHGHGDASSCNSGICIKDTVNPAVILATLQKEQSLITMRTKNDGSLNAAMGYACPDSGGCNSKYRGFTKQVENGAWQLRFNYERAKGHGFKDYQVGQKVKIDGKSVKIATRSQSALYRYTPHYNSNFSSFFTQYNLGSVSTVAASGAPAAVSAQTTNYVGINCKTIKSKQNRRLCNIAQAKAKAAAKK